MEKKIIYKDLQFFFLQPLEERRNNLNPAVDEDEEVRARACVCLSVCGIWTQRLMTMRRCVRACMWVAVTHTSTHAHTFKPMHVHARVQEADQEAAPGSETPSIAAAEDAAEGS